MNQSIDSGSILGVIVFENIRNAVEQDSVYLVGKHGRKRGTQNSAIRQTCERVSRLKFVQIGQIFAPQ